MKIYCSRSRKGAWIEILPTLSDEFIQDVAPARERGLKSSQMQLRGESRLSLPQGSVD